MGWRPSGINATILAHMGVVIYLFIPKKKPAEDKRVVITTYRQSSDFLARAQAELERNEVLNGLPLGITLHLYKFPERIKIRPYLSTVEDEGKLLVAALIAPPSRLIAPSNQVHASGVAPSLLIHNLRDNVCP